LNIDAKGATARFSFVDDDLGCQHFSGPLLEAVPEVKFGELYHYYFFVCSILPQLPTSQSIISKLQYLLYSKCELKDDFQFKRDQICYFENVCICMITLLIM